MTGMASDPGWRTARCRPPLHAQAELAHPPQVVLYPEPARLLSAAHAQDVDLIDTMEVSAGRRRSRPATKVADGV